MAIYVVQLLTCFVIIMVIPAQNGAESFQMSCKNIDTHINIVSGDSHQFHCSSNKKFNLCKIERKTNGKTRYCKFKFNRPLYYPGQKPKPAELQRINWECLLDPGKFRIKILER